METSLQKIKKGTSHYILTCQTPYTIKHVQVERGALAITRERHLKTDNIRDMFENVHMDDVLSFLRGTGLFVKI